MHQRNNAQPLVDMGGAVMETDHIDAAINAAKIGPAIESLMGDGARRDRMHHALRSKAMPDAAWTHRSMPFDAHFDDDFWFYFRSRDEMTRFKARYKSTWAMQRVNGEWKRTRRS